MTSAFDTVAGRDVSAWRAEDGESERVVPCVVLVDTSSAMRPWKMEGVNAGLRVLGEALASDDAASRQVELALMAFDEEPVVVQFFTSATEFRPPELTGDGRPLAGAAIVRALTLMEERMGDYERLGVTYVLPNVVVVTSGGVTLDDGVKRAFHEARKEMVGRMCHRVGYALRGGIEMDVVVVADHSDAKQKKFYERAEYFKLLSGKSPSVVEPEGVSHMFRALARKLTRIANSDVIERLNLPREGWAVPEGFVEAGKEGTRAMREHGYALPDDALITPRVAAQAPLSPSPPSPEPLARSPQPSIEAGRWRLTGPTQMGKTLWTLLPDGRVQLESISQTPMGAQHVSGTGTWAHDPVSRDLHLQVDATGTITGPLGVRPLPPKHFDFAYEVLAASPSRCAIRNQTDGKMIHIERVGAVSRPTSFGSSSASGALKAAAVLGAGAAIVGGLFAAASWLSRKSKGDEEAKDGASADFSTIGVVAPPVPPEPPPELELDPPPPEPWAPPDDY